MPPVPHSISRVYSLLQRLRSLRHHFWYGVSARLRWSRGAFHETPARELPALTLEQTERIAALRSRYQVQFELRMNVATSLNNYEYLDILDRAWAECRLGKPAAEILCDVGCASFWYGATLQAFFRPRQLAGVEVEGYRLFKDGHTRIDYAAGYLSELPNARFLVVDYRDCTVSADVITAWFPFLTAAAILAWRLPLSLLAPGPLFERIYHNLSPGGLFVMVNHGRREAGIGADFCRAIGLERVCVSAHAGVLSGHRLSPAILSCWRRPR
jgi:hypothetical protein